MDRHSAELKQLNVGFMGLLLEEGTHRVELRYQPPYYHPALLVAIGSLIVYVLLLRRHLSGREPHMPGALRSEAGD